MPDAITYLLTGEKVTEYTIASTSQLIDAEKKCFDPLLLGALGLKAESFGRFVMPGTLVGTLTPEVQTLTGLPAIPVVAVAGHDTASAVAAVPALNKNFAYLSSGTWSLMGIESQKPIINDESFKQNFTNEGGVDGTIRFLKNICGLWLLEQCRKEWGNEENSYGHLIAAAEKAEPFHCFINPDASDFANPTSMIAAIKHYCKVTGQDVPSTKGQIVRCIFESLAYKYKQTLLSLQQFADFPIEHLHVIGGGSRNALLNSFTASALGIPVMLGPAEATAIGNIMIQAKAAGVFTDLASMRKSISAAIHNATDNASTSLSNNGMANEFLPKDQALWDENFMKYLKVVNSYQ